MSEEREINVLSLFDGMSCGQIALNRIGIKPKKYYAAEIDKFAKKITQKNYPNTIQLGDVTKWKNWDIEWDKIDLVTAGFPCFAAGTLVTTDRGLVPIEEVVKGDKVLTHTNKFKEVVVPMMKVSNHINMIKIQGALPLQVTDEHPFYVRKMTRKYLKGKNVRVFDKPEWVDCKNLTKECFIGVPINQKSIIPKFGNLPTSKKTFWYMVGRYVADGYSSTSKPQSRGKNLGYRTSYKTIINCGHHEFQELESIVSQADFHATKSKDRTSYKFIISNKVLWQFIQHFGRGAENKKIPSFVFDMPSYLIREFIEGYVSGDGHEVKRKGSRGNIGQTGIASVSVNLLTGVQQLIQKVYKTQPSLSLNKTSNKKIIEGREVNQKDFYTLKFYREKPKQANFYVDESGNYLWVPFKSINRIEKSLPVYNFEVEDDNSYCVSNLIVHNCQAWSIAGKQLGDRDDRGALFWTTLDIMKKVLESNPNAKFLLENVKMKKEFEDYITTHTEKALGKVNKILINSALVSAQNRQRFYWTNINGITQPEDKNILLKDVICNESSKKWLSDEKSDLILAIAGISNKERKDFIKRGISYSSIPNEIPIGYFVYPNHLGQNGKLYKEKSATLTCAAAGLVVDIKDDKKHLRKLNITELERLQTVPIRYTEGVSDSQRKKMLGNGWTVDVISHIFRSLKEVL